MFVKLADLQSTGALTIGQTVTRQALLQGCPVGMYCENLWIFTQKTYARGVGAQTHQPQSVAAEISNIQGRIGRHTISITDGRDLYAGMEVLRGSISAQNTVMGPGDVGGVFRYPIPMHYLFGGDGERLTRPPSEELEGQSLTIGFGNPYTALGDVDTVQYEVISVFGEFRSRGELMKQDENDPGLFYLDKWGLFLGSRTGNAGARYLVTDVIPSVVILKDRSWSSMSCEGKGTSYYKQLTPDQLMMVDGERWSRYPNDPILGFQLDAEVRSALPIEFNVPHPSGIPEVWTKLLDLRNERDALGPYEFLSDSAYNFENRGIILIGRVPVSGSPKIRRV